MPRLSENLRMPWGFYRGRKLVDLPSSYLKALAGSDADLSLRAAADGEYGYREDSGSHWDEVWVDELLTPREETAPKIQEASVPIGKGSACRLGA
jgi:aromatic ring-opening dioxygenase LigB subunit